MSNEQTGSMGNEERAGAASSGSEESASSTAGAQEPNVSEQDLMDELSRVSGQFVDLVRTAWHSEQRHQIEAEVKHGINSIASGLEEGFRKVGESEQTRESVDKARQAAESATERVRESSTGQELAAGLLKGLRMVSRQLDKLADELEPAAPSAESGTTAAPANEDAQDIPVQRDE